ncbi:MAG: hypothetical protein HN736_17400 [Anaerolineae bacterium]|jgi:hypothetical protein|nr:hypothetical protein [Anaerolineae bacterium]MBT4309063.1 hypothetical protein [Anaerolineae bacterium]MBT4460025.1 hypothetical protein [Anaerolineae bacterium]MBT6059834.1 hypothetical protein [Anaerolineae bacterium]MBT6324103.1 hypothetical protein [Anaerolineae bacterium]
MKPRALELFDLPKLPRYRKKVFVLDSRRALTRGNPLRAVSFLAYLNPKGRIYTGILEGDEGTVLGGIVQHNEERFARLAYLAPADAPFALIDHLTAQAGKWKAHQIVAEIDEGSSVFESLRHCGFAVYSHQRIWDMSYINFIPDFPYLWRKKEEQDLIAIQNLQRELVPPLLKQVESFTDSSSGMLVRGEKLSIYMDITEGPRGIYLRPLVHPNADHLLENLFHLLTNFPNRRARPVYLCVRSHQAWIEPILEEFGARPAQLQIVMVKHLVNKIHEAKTVPSGGNTAWANPAAPINGHRAMAKFGHSESGEEGA